MPTQTGATKETNQVPSAPNQPHRGCVFIPHVERDSVPALISGANPSAMRYGRSGKSRTFEPFSNPGKIRHAGRNRTHVCVMLRGGRSTPTEPARAEHWTRAFRSNTKARTMRKKSTVNTNVPRPPQRRRRRLKGAPSTGGR